MHQTPRYTAAAAALALTIGIAGCSTSGTDAASSELSIGIAKGPTSWNPANSEGGETTMLFQAVYDTLLTLTPAGEPAAELATSWTYDDTRTALTLELQDDVVLGDGTDFTAEMVEPSLMAIKGGSGGFSAALSSLESVEVVDASTVTLHLSDPDPALLYNLGLGASYILPAEGLASDSLETTPGATGPYTLDEAATVSGSSYVLTKNEDFWNADAYAYDKLTFTVLTDATARLNALQSGQVDAIRGEISMIEAADAAGLTVESGPLDWRGLVIGDRAGEMVPALADVRVRQAINYAIDGAGILETIDDGNGTRSTQIFNPAANGYDETFDEAYPHDPERARELLAEAGYPDGFTLPMASITSIWGSYEPVIEAELAEVGITVEYTTVQPSDIVAAFAQYPVFVVSWQTATESYVDVLQMLSATSLINPQATTDATVEGLVEQMRVGDDEQRAAAGKELSAYLVEQAWFAPWESVNNAVTISTDAVTFELQAGNVVPSLRSFAPAE